VLSSKACWVQEFQGLATDTDRSPANRPSIALHGDFNAHLILCHFKSSDCVHVSEYPCGGDDCIVCFLLRSQVMSISSDAWSKQMDPVTTGTKESVIDWLL
jgi:hypothetical protein